MTKKNHHRAFMITPMTMVSNKRKERDREIITPVSDELLMTATNCTQGPNSYGKIGEPQIAISSPTRVAFSYLILVLEYYCLYNSSPFASSIYEKHLHTIYPSTINCKINLLHCLGPSTSALSKTMFGVCDKLILTIHLGVTWDNNAMIWRKKPSLPS
jgi:hypothetical protein